MTVAWIVCSVAVALALSYVLIYIAASAYVMLIGVLDPAASILTFSSDHLCSQLPLILLLGFAWVACALADSLRTDILCGECTEGDSRSSAACVSNMLLRAAHFFARLASRPQLCAIASAPTTTALTESSVSNFSPLVGGWSPSTHPSLIYG